MSSISEKVRTAVSQCRESFFIELVRSSLLAPTQIGELLGRAVAQLTPENAMRFAANAVESAGLTDWQVQALVDGRRRFRYGEYQLLELLGEGGMGSVFRAQHFKTMLPAAVKLIHRTYSSRGSVQRRFRREMELAVQFKHPNVVRAFDAAVDETEPYLVMELVPGPSLQHFVRGHGIPPLAISCDFARQAALGLQYAHEFGVIHRDVKPSNIMVHWPVNQATPTIKVLDFGLTRLLDNSVEVGITATGQCIGTPEYISPEQAVNAKCVDGRTDVFSLGCTLFHLLAGRLPYEGTSAIQVLVARMDGEPALLSKFRPNTPPELDAILKQSMARNPDDRISTVGEFARRISPFAQFTSADRDKFFLLASDVMPIDFSCSEHGSSKEVSTPEEAVSPNKDWARIRNRLGLLIREQPDEVPEPAIDRRIGKSL